MRRLAAHADVLVENFKVGGLERYGLDHASLRKANPRLVYCSITGFGQDGPYAKRAGYDFIVQGLGGIMDLTGEPDGEPQKIGVAFADIFTGVYAGVAILAALRRRDETGEGAHIDMALLDTQVGVLANQAMSYLVSGAVPKRMGNAHPSIVPYQVFPAADGHLIVAVGNDPQFARFAAILGAPELASDPRFVTNADRVENRDALAAILAELTAQGRATTLLAALEQRRRAGRADQLGRRCLCRSAGRGARHAHRSERRWPRPAARSRACARRSFSTESRPPPIAPSPALGAHNGEVLADPNWGGEGRHDGRRDSCKKRAAAEDREEGKKWERLRSSRAREAVSGARWRGRF